MNSRIPISHRSFVLSLVGGSLLLSLAACGGGDDGGTAPTSDPEAELTRFIRDNYDLHPMPEQIPYPPDNPPVEERVELGRLLFFDPVLSGPQDVSCGHCHHPALAWADGRSLSIGVGGVGLGPDRQRTLPEGDDGMEEWEFITPRNSPTILNTAFNAPFPGGDGPWDGRMFWDGRTSSLENQARAPVRSRDEMRHDTYNVGSALTEVEAKLRSIPEYVDLFLAAFPEEASALGPDERELVINANTYARAVAAYERELVGTDSPYDRFARGDDGALTHSQKRGLALFHEVGCVECHSGPMFSDFEFRALGVRQAGPGKPPVHERGDGTDIGRFPEGSFALEEMYAFRTPSLRNVALTAPYFHTGGEGTDGDYQTLRQVVDFFDRGGNDEGIEAMYLHPFVRPLGLEEEQKDDLVAFLESLTATRLLSDLVDPEVPTTVPSGLEPPPALPPVLRP